MTTDKETLLIRLTPAIKARLRKSAAADRRSMAVKVEMLVEEALDREAAAAVKKKPRG